MPVKPMNDALVKASCMCFAYPFYIFNYLPIPVNP